MVDPNRVRRLLQAIRLRDRILLRRRQRKRWSRIHEKRDTLRNRILLDRQMLRWTKNEKAYKVGNTQVAVLIPLFLVIRSTIVFLYEETIVIGRQFLQDFLRVPKRIFNRLVRQIGPAIPADRRRHCIGAREKIAIFLYFLGSGAHALYLI